MPIARIASARVLAAVVALGLTVAGCTPPEATPEPVPPSPSVTVIDLTTPEPEPTPTPTPEPTDPLPSGAVNALFLGSDTRDATGFGTGDRSDVIVLAHITAARDKLYLISVARDTYVDIPGAASSKVNSAYARGGAELATKTISKLFGDAEISFTAETSFNSFTDLVGALGGITVTNAHASTVGAMSFPKGELKLTKENALTYVRQRKGLPMGDLDRAERHRAAITGILDRLAELSKEPAELASVMPALVDNVRVTGDFDLAKAQALVPIATGLERSDVVSLMVPLKSFGMIRGASVDLINETKMAALVKALKADTLDEYVDKYGTSYALG